MRFDAHQFPEANTLNDTQFRSSVLLEKSAEAKLKRINIDPDTGLLNFEGLCKEMSKGNKYNMIALIHLANYSVINTTLGNASASKLMNSAVNLLKQRLPEEEAFSPPPNGSVCNYLP